MHDYFHEDEQKASEGWINATLGELSKNVMKNPSLLDSEYDWLTSDDARRAYKFGNILGMTDKEFSLLPMLVDSHKNLGKANMATNFLGGYFAALFEHNKDLWQKNIVTLSKDKIFMRFIPILVCLSGMTDKAAKIVLSTIKSGHADKNEFFRFRYGSVINRISEPIFQQWLTYLVDNTSEDLVCLAVEFVYFYYIFAGCVTKLPRDITVIVSRPLANDEIDHKMTV